MNKATILVVGNNDILVTSNEWDVVTVVNAEAAIEKFQQLDIDVVVFANTAPEEEIKMSKLFLFQQQEVILLQNNNDGLITSNIKNALQNKHAANKPSFSFTDDALKAAELPITIQ